MTSRPGRSRLRTSLKCNSNVPNSPDAQRALGGARFDGAIVHPGGHEKRIPADSVDDAFVTQVVNDNYSGRFAPITLAARGLV